MAPKPDFPALVTKIVGQVTSFPGWADDDIRAIKAPALVVLGDSETFRPEHALELFRLLGGGVPGDLVGLPRARLAVLPATTHVGVIARVDLLTPLISDFLTARSDTMSR